MHRTLLLNDFLPAGGDMAAAFRLALHEAGGGNVTLRLLPGTYTITGSSCPGKFRAISNHDSGEYATAFDLTGARSVVFDGGGAVLQCIGRVIPFWIGGAEDITLRGFTLDWKRPFFTEGRIVESVPFQRAVLDIPRDLYPVEVAGGRLRFLGPEYSSDYLSNVMEVDAGLMEFAPYCKESWGFREGHAARELPGGHVELSGPFQSELRPGNLLVLTHEYRTSPVIVIDRSHGVSVEDVTMHSSGGMGVIAQMSSDLRVERLVVAPSPQRGSFASLDADATHFVECHGSLVLKDCRFSGQMDDSSNVHGIYLRVVESAGPREFVAEAAHFQQHHVDYFRDGEHLSLVEPSTFETLAVLEIETARRLDAARVLFEVREPLPPSLVGKAIGSAHRLVDLLIEGGRFEKHRARGLLLSAPGRMVARKNYFHVPGNGILSTCDCLDWFEAGPVGHLLVEENEFDHCGYGPRPFPAAIRLAPASGPDTAPDHPVSRNITIRRNVFRGRLPFVSLHRVEDVAVEDNLYFAGDGQPDALAPVMDQA